MKKGFSLVELSIVLVILGLLTGGILAGQSLIRAAELRSVATEFQKYQTAARSFQGKYMAIPGDMGNATSFWGTMTGCTAVNPTGTGTCNGNGDGLFGHGANGGAIGANLWIEQYGVWHHLMSSGMIEGTYTGVAGAGGANDAIIGTNVPPSKLSRSGWTAFSLSGTFAGNTTLYAGDFNRVFIVGEKTTNDSTHAAAFTPGEAWGIDTKLDDGKSGTGMVVANSPSGWNNAGGTLERCTFSQNATDTSASYALSVASKQCSLYFKRAF